MKNKLHQSPELAPTDDLDEGLSSVVSSRLGDLARGFFFKARPILVLHNTQKNSTITFKLKRSLISHSLVMHEEGKGERVLKKSPSALHLLGVAVKEASSLIGRGYLEI